MHHGMDYIIIKPAGLVSYYLVSYMRATFFGVDADSARALLIATIGRAAAQHVTRAMRAAVFFFGR